MEENRTDLKYVLIFLACVVIAIVLNINYFFSTDTMSQIKVVDNVELAKEEKDFAFGKKE